MPEECPKCDALKEELANLRREYLSQNRQVTDMVIQVMKEMVAVWRSESEHLVRLAHEINETAQEAIRGKHEQ